LDIARDELFSHIQRCDVLEAHWDDRTEWLEDTIAYMKQRYPTLGDLELASLEQMATRYLKPAIPHGRDKTALNREAWVNTATTAPAPAEDREKADNSTPAGAAA